MTQITSFKQIKEIIEPIPADKFQIRSYGHSPFGLFGDNRTKQDNGKSCFLGHIHRHFNPEDSVARGDCGGYGARDLTKHMLNAVHGIDADGSEVNNHQGINGYNETKIKDRIMHMIEDGIKWEDSKK